MIDFNSFKTNLKEATKSSFSKLRNISDLYAFALFSDENCQTILPVANTVSYLQKVREDYEDSECLDCKFNPEEWNYDILENEPEFLELTKLLAQEDKDSKKNEEEFDAYQDKFYNICIEVLTELKNEGFFRENYDKDIFLVFAASEFEFEQENLKSMIIKLNSDKYVLEYLNWLDTWEID